MTSFVVVRISLGVDLSELARLTFYGVHIFLDVMLSEPGSIDILCFRF